jgi:peroxiredoxin
LGPIETPSVSGAKVGVTAGSIAPNFRLERTDGSPMELASLRGRPVLLNFWATWCGPCRTEMPEFQRIHERLGDRLVVLSVNQRESPGQVEDFYKELGLTFPAVLDRRAKVAEAYRLFGLPGTYLIDARGVIQSVKFGPFADEADLLKTLEKVGV